MYQTVESHGRQYKVTPGSDPTYYYQDTPDKVIDALESARRSGTRIRIWLGEAGKVWQEEWDIMGTVHRSMGPVKIPLLVNSRRSMGGGAISSAIVRIMTTAGRELYRASDYCDPDYKIIPADMPDYAECVTIGGEVHARFKKAGQAARWIQFMEGERFNK